MQYSLLDKHFRSFTFLFAMLFFPFLSWGGGGSCTGPDQCSGANTISTGNCVSGNVENCTNEIGPTCGTGYNDYSHYYCFQATKDSMYLDYEVTNGSNCASDIQVFGGFASCGGGCPVQASDLVKEVCDGGAFRKIVELTNLTVGDFYIVLIRDEEGGPCNADGYDLCLEEMASPCNSPSNPCGSSTTYCDADSVSSFSDLDNDGACYDQRPPSEWVQGCYTFTALDDTMDINAGSQFEGCGFSSGYDTIHMWLYDSGGNKVDSCIYPENGGTLSCLTVDGLTVGDSYTVCWEAHTVCDYVTSFCPWQACIDDCDLNPCSTLPIELLSFEGAMKNNVVELAWSTATEINNDYFVVQRSDEGENFNKLAKIPGAGNTTSKTNYSYMDNAPRQGVNYYRLKQVDFDGSTSYSDVIEIDYVFGGNFSVRNIQPVPAHEEVNLTIHSISRQPVYLQLFDNTGRQVITKKIQPEKGDNEVSINVTSLPEGIYYLKLRQTQDQLIKKILVH